MKLIGLMLAALAPTLATAQPMVQNYTESSERKGAMLPFVATKPAAEDLFFGSARQNYRQYSERVRVPGFISTAALPRIATLVGPTNVTASFRIGDTIFLRWTGASSPAVGERYNTFTPALVLQSLEDPTQFSVILEQGAHQKTPSHFRRAGFFYESSGKVRITKVSQGIVEAVIEGLRGQIAMGDQLMPLLPMKPEITPISGGVQISAAVVAGSPVESLSTATRAFIYINRGARDGMREGQIFQAVETVRLDDGVAGPDVTAGEAMVVHVSDSYSTAIITKQFDVIRIGSLLKTKQDFDPLTSKEPFSNLFPKKDGAKVGPAPDQNPADEIPDMGEFSTTQDTTLPDPTRKPRKVEPSLSELDALERAQKFQSLTPAEKTKLGTLSRQEKLEVEASETAEGATTMENSFGKPAAKKAEKKKRVTRQSDEEELNHLMMQN